LTIATLLPEQDYQNLRFGHNPCILFDEASLT